MRKTIATIATLVFCLLTVDLVRAQTTEITYQGQLQSSSLAASGNFDFEFLLFDAPSGGSQIGSTVTRNGVAVANGIFSVSLDFGSSFPGSTRFLEIHVKQSGGGAFTNLNPRQPITSSPYSVKSLTADTATNAVTAVNATAAATATSFSGPLAGDVTGTQGATTVARLQGRNVSNTAPLNDQVLKFNTATNQWLPGTDNTSAGVNAILNQTTPQAGANFNISGTGTAGAFDATTQFNIAGTRVVSVAGTNNLFVGQEAGVANAGAQNSFFGRRAGSANTSGGFNSFFGFETGFVTNTGNSNSFFGTRAGTENTTGSANTFLGSSSGQSSTSGSQNTFVGLRAGETNTTGSFNTAIGFDSDVGSGNLIAATAIGAGAVASASHTVVLGTVQDAVQIPGTLTVTGSINGNINAASITTGTLDNARLGVIPITNGGTGSATKNFIDLTTAQTVAGDKTFSGTLSGNIVSASTQFNIGGSRILSTNAPNGTFVGIGANAANGLGINNSFFGRFAGNQNTGERNSFFGANSGAVNGAGVANSFFGANAGGSNTTGALNAFFGSGSGSNSSTGDSNSFFGEGAGAVTGSGSFNSFFGRGSGFFNLTGDSNAFFGFSAGNANTSGTKNTAVGSQADLGAPNLTFATAIGAGAIVSTSNTVVLGRTADSTVIPGSSLDVGGAITSTRPSVAQQTIQIAGGNGSSIRLTAQSAPAADKPLLVQNLSAEASPTTNNNIQFQVGTSASPSTKLTINSTGDVGIGTTTPNDKLEVNGSIRVTTLGAAGATTLCRNASNQISTCSSSARYKSNITPFGFGLSLVKQLRPVSFTWKDGGLLDMGLVAEEVNAVEPLLTNLNDKGQVEGVKYDRIGVVLVNAVKEQQAQIEAQQKLIDQQRAENEALKARILAIEKALAKRP